jgi:hypothetical protein
MLLDHQVLTEKDIANCFEVAKKASFIQ